LAGVLRPSGPQTGTKSEKETGDGADECTSGRGCTGDRGNPCWYGGRGADTLSATKVESKGSGNGEPEIKGPIASADATAQTITLLGLTVDVSAATVAGAGDDDNQNNGLIRYTSVFDAPGHSRVAVDKTFATSADAPAAGLSLYRFSTGRGGIKCEGCHGSTHAEFPAAHRNNIQSIQHQGHVGMLAECTTCHGSQPNTVTGGPHGMHPVGQSWVNAHADAVEAGGSAACRSCHGADDRGTVLSRAKADRLLSTPFGAKYFWRGYQVGCYTCHLGPSNDNGNPNQPPVAVSGSAFTPINTPVTLTLGVRDPDGNTLAVRVVSQPDHGTVGLVGTSATYFPDTGFSGTDGFIFAAWDGAADSNLGTMSLTVGNTGASSPAPTATATPTFTSPRSPTRTSTRAASPMVTRTPTPSPSRPRTPTQTPTMRRTPTPTFRQTASPTRTPTMRPTPTPNRQADSED